jgi:hypothetical protein
LSLLLLSLLLHAAIPSESAHPSAMAVVRRADDMNVSGDQWVERSFRTVERNPDPGMSTRPPVFVSHFNTPTPAIRHVQAKQYQGQFFT